MATSSTNILAQIAIILVRPRIAENIGSAARICQNMGIPRLIVVRDELPDAEKMARTATHKAAHLVRELEIYPTLAEALQEFSIIVGTTARRGRQRCAEQSPRQVIAEILPLVQTNPTAFVFGPEDTGLTNEELQMCQYASAIPTADFSSLNLAQAVTIHCYEIYHGLIQDSKELTPAPTLANSFEMESMYAYVEESLETINFLDTVNKPYWMGHLRRFFGRMMLTSKEANIIRGICKKFLLHSGAPQSDPNTGDMP